MGHSVQARLMSRIFLMTVVRSRLRYNRAVTQLLNWNKPQFHVICCQHSLSYSPLTSLAVALSSPRQQYTSARSRLDAVTPTTQSALSSQLHTANLFRNSFTIFMAGGTR